MENYSVIDDAAGSALTVFIIIPVGFVLLILLWQFVTAHPFMALAAVIGMIGACVLLNKLYKKLAQLF